MSTQVKITSIDQLAGVMLEVFSACEEPLDHADFCDSMVSCAVTIAEREGLGDKAIFEMVIRAATSALVTVRARQEFEKRGLDTTNLEVH